MDFSQFRITEQQNAWLGERLPAFQEPSISTNSASAGLSPSKVSKFCAISPQYQTLPWISSAYRSSSLFSMTSPSSSTTSLSHQTSHPINQFGFIGNTHADSFGNLFTLFIVEYFLIYPFVPFNQREDRGWAETVFPSSRGSTDLAQARSLDQRTRSSPRLSHSSSRASSCSSHKSRPSLRSCAAPFTQSLRTPASEMLRQFALAIQ